MGEPEPSRPLPLSRNDSVTARRALAHALGGYLGAPQVREAVALWNRHFEGKVGLFVGLTRYCKQIADVFGLPGKEAELHLKIFRALQIDPRQLPGDPLSQPPGEAMSTLPQPDRAEPGQGAFVLQCFHGALELLLARDHAAHGLTPALLRRTLVRRCAVLPAPQRHAAQLWWSGQVAVLGGAWPPGGHGTALVNVMYVTLAELIGPVAADRCFMQAVARLEASGDAALLEVRRYL